MDENMRQRYSNMIEPGYKPYRDTNFVTGDSPVELDIFADLERAAHRGAVLNSGSGDMGVEFSEDGTTYGDVITVAGGKGVELDGLEVRKIRLTWIADTAYDVLVN